MKKRWFKSKTLLVNTLAALAIIIQAITGQPWLDAELQGAIIVIANVVLRIITKSGLEK